MILGILLLVITGIIYYSTHKIPPEPIFREEVYVEETDFWDDMTEDDFEEETLPEAFPKQKTVALPIQVKKPNLEKKRQQEKSVGKRRKRRKIAKRSRQQNRN
jgi:hypothetical protein